MGGMYESGCSRKGAVVVAPVVVAPVPLLPSAAGRRVSRWIRGRRTRRQGVERDKQEEQGMPRERKLSTDAPTHVRTVQDLADSLLADNFFLAESLSSLQPRFAI